jgi:uncharacterized protein
VTDKVVHFEIPCGDKEKAGEFYSNVFDWKMNPVPDMNYTIAHTVEVDEKQMPKEVGAINGGLFNKGDGPVQVPTITIKVDDISGKLEKIKSSGGEVVKEKSLVGDMGYIAYFRDTERNIIGLWEDRKREE